MNRKSVRCNIRNMSSSELVAHHEEPEEFGGYFIINGNERLIRYLILPRRNHVISLLRPSFSNRGPSYTQYAVQIRGVRPDQTAATNTLHYLSNGNAMFRFSWRKQEYVIPVMLILKALVGASDREIFEGIIMQDYGNTFMTDRVELLLRSFKTYKLYTGEQCLDFLGEKFRVVLGLPEDWNNTALGAWLLQKMVLVHLQAPRDKFRMLLCVFGGCIFNLHSLHEHQQVHASKTLRSCFVFLLCRQPGLSPAPGSSSTRITIRNDNQRTLRRSTQRRPFSNPTGHPQRRLCNRLHGQ